MQTRRKVMKQMGAAALLPAVASATPFAVGPAVAQDLKTVRLADQNGSEVDYAAVWVAELNGYYKDEGIKIERKTYANGPSALLDINNLDAVMAAIVPFMQYAARGGDIKIVMSVTKGNAPIVGKKQYTSAKDLNGKKVGTPGIGTIHDAVLGYIQQTQGLKFEHVPAKITDVAVMIQKGEVEAFIGWEPASAAAIAQAPDLLHYIERLPPVPNSESLQLAFTPAYTKANPETVTKFVRATLRGIDWIKANGKEKTAELVAKKMNDPKSYPVNLNALGSVDLTQPRLDMPSTRIWLTTIAKQGKIPADLVKDVDGWVGKYLDYSFLDKAEASLKKK
ncbi:MAG: ABC transporter substrate-binding protein [Hyphomicrobiaceae bacterium]|nr:MAG: ABC transporter substrate-binding protein [Hyphomicrobiaceae bacterium]